MNYQEIKQRIERAKHIVVIAHVNPDADSLSSASAFYSYVLTLHKKVTFFCASSNIDTKLNFLPWMDKLKHTFPSDADLAVSLDCGSVSRVGVEVEIDLINIDHHESNNSYGNYQIVNPTAISTTAVLFDFFHASDIKINKKMATALYAGLIDDSHSFSATKTDAKTFEMASTLVASGADIELCTHYLCRYISLAAYRLKGAMMLDMKLYADAQVAYLHVSQQMLQQYGANPIDCESALQEALYLPTVKIALLIRENRNATLKASLRSDGEFEVHKIAAFYGGGGHPHSSGFTLKEEGSEEVLKQIIQLIKEDKK